MTDYGQTYGELRERVSGLVREAGDDQLHAMCPAAPEWRVRDVVAHLSGVCADIVNGNLEGVATDEWTDKHVSDRQDWPIDKLLEDWVEQSSAMAALVPSFPEVAAGQWVTDGVTHEHDIRGGLGTPGARDSDAIDVAFHWSQLALDASEPLVLESEAGTVHVGEGDPVATVRASRFELIRSMTGRRSLDQMRSYDWDGEPRPERLVFAIFTPRPTPLVE
jgi:uncharacterized protein (TIGR03083 family)